MNMKSHKIIYSVLTLFIIFQTSGCSDNKVTQQNSFSCYKAKNRAERIICSSDELTALDAKMTSRYKRAITSVDYPAQLKDEQRTWISQYRNRCENRKCLFREYEKRIDELQAAVSEKYRDEDYLKTSRTRIRRQYPEDEYEKESNRRYFDDSYDDYEKKWQGKWTKSNYSYDDEGTLRVRQINEKRLSFRLVSPGSRKPSQVMGEASIDGSLALYRDRGRDCEIEFYLKSRSSIEVNTSNGCRKYENGDSDFDGIYSKE